MIDNLLANASREIIVTVDGRYDGINTAGDSLKKALIPLTDGKYIELSQLAIITEREREPDIFARLNGRKTASIAIMGRHDTDLRKLSADIKKEIAALSLPLEFTVLSDLGAEEAAAFRSVLNAALTGAIMVAIIGFLLNGKKSLSASGFFRALTVPLICLISIAVLTLCGYGANKLMLAGIAAGVGTAVDSVILCSEKLRKCFSYEASSAALKRLAGPLFAGAATTVAALLPLTAIKNSGAGVIAISIAVTCITALVMSLTILPPLLLWTPNYAPHKLPHKRARKQLQLFKTLRRFLAANVRFCTRYPAAVLAIGGALTVCAIFALFLKGADTTGGSSEDSVYAQIEFEGGLLTEEVDRRLAVYGEQLAGFAGIKNVETGARNGSASLLVSFDPKLTKAQIVREAAKQTPIMGGFVFFHESSANERYWEIKIHGEDDAQCRKLARELAIICASHPLVKDRVLNFKEGSKKLVLLPDRTLFAETGIGFSAAAANLRTGVYGPVAYKRTDENGETDVRITAGSADVMRQSREGTLGILISGGSGERADGVLQIRSLMHQREETEPSSIRRDDRRTTASITITTKPMDPRRVKRTLLPLFEKIDLPPGYSIEFDPQAIRESQALTETILSFVMAILFCYMIIASINESFIIPLIVLAAIPVSLSVPALCLVLSGSAYNMATACAFIAASGMTVNAAVFCIDGLCSSPRNVYSALREKMPVLLATTGTTAAGVVPFLFLREGANLLIRTISLVSALGVTCSCLCSITVIPSLFIILKKVPHTRNIPLVRNKNQKLGEKHEK